MSKNRPLAKALTNALDELDETRADSWKTALENNKGVIAHASDDFNFTRQRGYFLTKQYDLQEYARELRRQGGPLERRPRN